MFIIYLENFFPRFVFKIFKYSCVIAFFALLFFALLNALGFPRKSAFIPTYEVNRVQKGDTYKQFPLNFFISPRECMRICLSEDECMAWNYIIPESEGASGLCQLKHESTLPLIDLKAVSGIARE